MMAAMLFPSGGGQGPSGPVNGGEVEWHYCHGNVKHTMVGAVQCAGTSFTRFLSDSISSERGEDGGGAWGETETTTADRGFSEGLEKLLSTLYLSFSM